VVAIAIVINPVSEQAALFQSAQLPLAIVDASEAFGKIGGDLLND
jgi:hypothetical protein